MPRNNNAKEQRRDNKTSSKRRSKKIQVTKNKNLSEMFNLSGNFFLFALEKAIHLFNFKIACASEGNHDNSLPWNTFT